MTKASVFGAAQSHNVSLDYLYLRGLFQPLRLLP